MEPLLVAIFASGFSILLIWFLRVNEDHNEVEIVIKNSKKIVLVEECKEKETEEKLTSFIGENRKSSPKPKPFFKWPKDSETLVDIQKRREGATELSQEMKLKLETYGILRQNSGKPLVIENISELARNTGILMPRRNLWVTFDMFLNKKRPGLPLLEDTEESNKTCKALDEKKKKKQNKMSKNDEDLVKWKNENTSLFREEKENLIKFVRAERLGFVRSF